ncbi:MAG: aromatic amino acid hydroxylase [Halioglobus sp.]
MLHESGQLVSQADIVASLPVHLRPFVRVQDYLRYTARDQAVWRFVMRHLTRQLRETAHPVYLEGLAKTGIALDHIPSIDEMNAALAQLGWRAVVVDGFIPPAIFMEFQALKVLVIALEMRSVDHILYTPAPDIVHESAGHAPFIVDVDYAEFLQRFGEVGMKAIATEHDFQVYEAIRALSIVKECPASSEQDIAKAQAELLRLSDYDGPLSEAALLTRLHWWTVEYGLVGELDDYKLFGAGLLSSLDESVRCMNDDVVHKLPLTVDAITAKYDITCQQPHLFVTKSCKHLSQVLEEFAACMCFRRGGASSLREAIDAGTVCTAQYDTGVQVSGQLGEVICDAVGKAVYFRTAGPTQLAWKDRELFGHGTSYHDQGFSSPVGLLKDFSRCLSQYTFDELRAHNINIGQWVTLEFLSGVTVSGLLTAILRQEHQNLLLSFEQCTVTDLHGRQLFQPEWGTYDMAVGAAITSVFGGSADRSAYQLHKPLPSTATVSVAVDEDLMDLYKHVAELVAAGRAIERRMEVDIIERLNAYPCEWLVRAELFGWIHQDKTLAPALAERLEAELVALAENPELTPLIQLALQTSATSIAA